MELNTGNRILITGANGQLGRALQKEFPDAVALTRNDLDITNPEALAAIDWSNFDVIINTAAYTKVDEAETDSGKALAQEINVSAVRELGRVASRNDLTLVHISSDYVFDGTKQSYDETDSFNPLSVYGKTKAEGDEIIKNLAKHYIIRTSWVVGDGKNFVRTMENLVKKNISPKVVNDQVGRLTFADTLASGIKHLLDSQASYGTYNLTNSGDVVSWADIAKQIYTEMGDSSDKVTPISTKEYYSDKDTPYIADRPKNSTLDLEKIEATGFNPPDWRSKLTDYIIKDTERGRQ